MTNKVQPLSGVRVLDCTQVFAGPFCTYQLKLLGAEIIKVEPLRTGDTLRGYVHGNASGNQMGGSFVAINAGKKSIALDLKQPRGKEIFRRLVESADVLVENFRAGVMDRLGFSWEACRALNPRLVYVTISGYGHTGPYKDFPALDHVMQAMSGMMALNGEPDTPPLKVGFPVIDAFVGQIGAFATLAALMQRDRTDEGQLVDVAMLDTALVLMTSMVVPYLNAGIEPPRLGNRGYSGAPTSDIFPTKDGMLSLGANHQSQCEALFKAIDAAALLDDPRFASREARIVNAAPLRAALEAALAAKTAQEWEPIINRAGVPASKLRSVQEICAHEQLADRGLFQRVKLAGDDDRPVTVLNSGIRAEWSGGVESPPLLGEHTDAILADRGYTAEDVATFRREGIVG